MLEESLAQVHVVAADPLGDRAARADDLQEIDAGDPGGTVRATFASVRRIAGWTRGGGGSPGKRDGWTCGSTLSKRGLRAALILAIQV